MAKKDQIELLSTAGMIDQEKIFVTSKTQGIEGRI